MAAPDAVNLGFDGLEMAQGPRVVAGRKGGYPLHEGVSHAARDRVPLLPEGPQAVGELRKRRPVAAGRIGKRRVNFAEHEAGARDTPGKFGEPPPCLGLGRPAVEPEPPQER